MDPIQFLANIIADRHGLQHPDLSDDSLDEIELSPEDEELRLKDMAEMEICEDKYADEERTDKKFGYTIEPVHEVEIAMTLANGTIVRNHYEVKDGIIGKQIIK